MKTSPKRYKEVDWERVVEVLLLRAFHLYWTGERVIDATTANDLIQEVIQEFLNHPSGMGWEPKQGPLEKFLRIVLDRRWADPSFEDVETRLEPETKPENALADLERPSFLQAIRDRVKDYPDIEELLEAIEMLDDDDYDYANANQELAKLIGTSVKDIENRKKRLRRLLRDCEMKHDVNRWKRKQLLDLMDKLVDRPEELPEEELNALCQQISPERDPKEWIRSKAQDAARPYRLRSKNVPNHVQAILDATSEPSSIEDTRPSEMKKLIEALLSPKSARKVRESFAFQKKPTDKLSAKDRALLELLAGEIEAKDDEAS